MRHVLTADLLDAMRESLRNLEKLKLLSPDDLDILELRRDLEEKIAVLERQQSQGKKCYGRVKTMPDDARDILQKLIETCRDGETGYLHAASVADDSELKSYFQQQSLERARFRVELTDATKRLGEPAPDTSGSSTAVLHRAWFEVKDDFGGGDHTLLESVEQGEDSAKQSYESALEAKLPAGIAELVRNQYASVKAAHDHVRSWRDDWTGEKAA